MVRISALILICSQAIDKLAHTHIFYNHDMHFCFRNSTPVRDSSQSNTDFMVEKPKHKKLKLFAKWMTSEPQP